MLAFKKCYDRLFKEFRDKLLSEYSQMKSSYLSDYEANFQANKEDKNAHIKEIQAHIQDKERDITERKELYEIMKGKIYGLLKMKYEMHVKKVFFNEIVYHTELVRREKRLKAYSKNYMYRRNMRRLFYSWRGVTHVWFKERINREAVEYERT